jgi:LDH2 family malate/lactate/ureidoglycolate dehydrogenase
MMRKKGFGELIFHQYRSASISAVVGNIQAEMSDSKLSARSQNVIDGSTTICGPGHFVFILNRDTLVSKHYSRFMHVARYGQ